MKYLNNYNDLKSLSTVETITTKRKSEVNYAQL